MAANSAGEQLLSPAMLMGPDISQAAGRTCTACRRKKIKCDAKKPSCRQCALSSLPCQYVNMRKTGLPKGYVKSLEKLVEELKQENNGLRDELSHPPDASDGLSSNTEVMMEDPYDAATTALRNLVTLEEQHSLQKLYFDRCHPFMPVIHRPTFQPTAANLHLTLSMYALASRHDDGLAGKAEIMYSLAKQATQATLLSPNIDTLNALLLQAVYEIGGPNTSLCAVSTLGSAQALVSAFRLIRIDEEPFQLSLRWLEKPKDWVIEEGRRRTVLMALSLSRWLATITDREFGIPVASEIKLALPVSDEIWFNMGIERPSTEQVTVLETANKNSPFARFVQVLGIYDLINKYRHACRSAGFAGKTSELRRIDGLIHKFLQSFPVRDDALCSAQGEGLLDVTVLTLAHSGSLLLHNLMCSAQLSELSPRSRQTSSSHAEEILDIAFMAQDRPLLGNYMIPHSLIVAARVRLWELYQEKGHYRGRDMNLLVKCLLSFGKCWGLQEKLANHATSILNNELPFSEPLTTFEMKHRENKIPPRQRSATIIQRDASRSLMQLDFAQPASTEETGAPLSTDPALQVLPEEDDFRFSEPSFDQDIGLGRQTGWPDFWWATEGTVDPYG